MTIGVEMRRRCKQANGRWSRSLLGQLTRQIGTTRHKLRKSGSPVLARRLAALEAERDRIRAAEAVRRGPVPAGWPDAGDVVAPAGQPDRGTPTPAEIAARVAEIRREKGLPEAAYRT